MKNDKTPKPGSKDYNVEKTEALNTPKYNSSTDRRSSEELPATEHLQDPGEEHHAVEKTTTDAPKSDLGNDQDNEKEKERERIIRK